MRVARGARSASTQDARSAPSGSSAARGSAEEAAWSLAAAARARARRADSPAPERGAWRRTRTGISGPRCPERGIGRLRLGAQPPTRRRRARDLRRTRVAGAADGGAASPPADDPHACSIWTASGVMRHSRPGSTSTAPTASRGGELERFRLQPGGPVSRRRARAGGDAAVWTRASRRPAPTPADARFARSSCPCATPPGASSRASRSRSTPAATSPRPWRPWQPPGDFWFATDADGPRRLHDAARPRRSSAGAGRAARALADAAVARSSSSSPARGAAARRGRARSTCSDGKRDPDRVGARRHDRLGLLRGPVRARRLETIRGEAAGAFPPASLSTLRRDVAAALRAAAAGRARGHRHRLAARLRAGLASSSAPPRRSAAAGRSRSPGGEHGGRARPARGGRSTRWASASSGGSRRCAACTSSRARRTG